MELTSLPMAGNRPTTSRLQRIASAVVSHLARCREREERRRRKL